MRQAVRAPARERPSERRDEPARERPRAAHGNLLAEDRANGDLERIPRARDTEAGAGRDERREERIAAQHVADRERVRVDVENAPRAAHEIEEVRPRRNVERESEEVLPLLVRHAENARPSAAFDRAEVRVTANGFDSRKGAFLEKGKERRRVEREPERELQRHDVLVRAVLLRCARAAVLDSFRSSRGAR